MEPPPHSGVTTETPKQHNVASRVGLALFAVVIVALVLSCLLFVPQYIVARDLRGSREQLEPVDLAQARNDVRTTLLQGLGGAFFLATAFFTWRQIRISQYQLEVNRQQVKLAEESQRRQLEVSQKQLEVGREQQITERFTRAVEQLGSEKADVRSGAIYALERIGRDSNTDLLVVTEILSSYIRGRTSWAPPLDNRLEEKDSSESSVAAPLLQARAPDIESALTALGRLTPPRSITEILESAGEDRLAITWASEGPILIGVDIRNAKLLGGNFQAAQFQGSNLSWSDLSGSQFTLSNFNESILQGARLVTTDFQGALLLFASLEGAFAEEADFGWAKLPGCNMKNAFLRGARFIHAYLGHIDLDKDWRDREYMELQRHVEDEDDPSPNSPTMTEYFRRGNISDMRRFSLEGSFFANSSHPRGYVVAADLKGADIRGADFSGANLDGTNLTDAKADAETKWPLGFNPHQSGVVFVDVSPENGQIGVMGPSRRTP